MLVLDRIDWTEFAAGRTSGAGPSEAANRESSRAILETGGHTLVKLSELSAEKSSSLCP